MLNFEPWGFDMMNSRLLASAMFVGVLALPAVAHAAPKTMTRQVGDFVITAQSMIVGQTSTATVAGGGSPLYLASRPQKDGVVGLLMTYASGDRFVCSGSLASDRRSIITAAHCVSSGGGVKDPNLVSTDIFFWNGSDSQIWFEAGATSIAVTDWFVAGGYSGNVIDQNDIAVLRMADFAPAFATSYNLYLADPEGLEFNVAGYGARSNAGGSIGANLGTGRLREGDNLFDYRFGNPLFGNSLADFWGRPFSQVEFTYISDFDRVGFAANDVSDILATFLGVNGFADTGVGPREVGIAGGDSGGPGFIDGKLASVNSWGGTIGAGDFNPGLNSSWGEFSGYVPIFIHGNWISSVLFDNMPVIPEPQTWAMLIVGFGAVGFAARRRRAVGVVAA